MPVVYYQTLTTREVQQIKWEKTRWGRGKILRKNLINDYLRTKAVFSHIIEKCHKYQRWIYLFLTYVLQKELKLALTFSSRGRHWSPDWRVCWILMKISFLLEVLWKRRNIWLVWSKTTADSNQEEQELLGRTDLSLSSHYNLSIWYDN